MKYFNSNFIKFFSELSKNNSKDWFDKNRKTYQKEVKEPFKDLIEEMISQIQKYEPEVKINPSQAIMRINRDIRFSKDKTPYNAHVAANISKFGKKDKSYPGFYIQLSEKNILVYGGAYVLSTDQLERVRNRISKNLKEFKSIYSDKEFVKYYQEIEGEKHKRLAEEFKILLEKEPLIANKQFFYSGELDAKLITSERLADELMKYYKAGSALNRFLQTAL